jgi:chromosomal replication initiation ATPase DnaA
VSTHPPIHPRDLLRRVCDAYLVDQHDVLSQSRLKDVREARQMLYLLLYEQCGWPVTLIAHKLQRDHSTVCHGIARARERLATPGGAVLYRRMMGAPYVWVAGARPAHKHSGGSSAAR